MPPASFATVFDFRMKSSRVDFPWSTCPSTATTGGRSMKLGTLAICVWKCHRRQSREYTLESIRRSLADTHWIVSAIEHDSVLSSFGEIERMGGKVSYAHPKEDGTIT